MATMLATPLPPPALLPAAPGGHRAEVGLRHDHPAPASDGSDPGPRSAPDSLEWADLPGEDHRGPLRMLVLAGLAGLGFWTAVLLVAI